MPPATLSGPTITPLAPDPPSTYRLNANSFQQNALTTASGWQYAAIYTASSSPTPPPPPPPPASSSYPPSSISADQATPPLPPRQITLLRRPLPHPLTRSSSSSNPPGSPCPRRNRPTTEAVVGEWQPLPLPHLTQATEDGHNTVSMGLSEGDGRVHLAWDCHSDEVRYVRSGAGLVGGNDGGGVGGKGEREGGLWCQGSFAENGDDGGLKGLLSGWEVTYPRFCGLPGGGLLFECRVGRAGAGNAVVCRYERVGGGGIGESAGDGDDGGLVWKWTWLGCYLRGVDCSPYVNGVSLDRRRGRLWVTWTNRRFTEKQREGEQEGKAKAKAVQAGPNGPENNEDLGCLWSGDLGESWRVSDRCGARDWMAVAGEMHGLGPVSSRDERVIVKRIPRGSGIMNQEGQCVDSLGGVHVLMRDDSNGGINMWKHHWMVHGTGSWLSEAVPTLRATGTGSRGKLCCDFGSGHLYFVIPGNTDTSLTILRRRYLGSDVGNQDGEGDSGLYGPFEVVWQGMGFDGEPLIDEERLCSGDRTLSVMTRTAAGSAYTEALVAVLDWHLGDSSPGCRQELFNVAGKDSRQC